MFLFHPSPPPPHEFSFTLPLHPLLNSEHAATPADDIFLHGHLLPLNSLVKEKERTMPSALSAFLGLESWRKRSRTTADDKNKNKNKNKNKKAFDAAQFLKKKYASMVEPLLLFFFNKDKESKRRVTRRRYSFSGHSGYIFAKEKWKKKRTTAHESSAPTSARTSPPNSGRLAGTPSVSFSSSDNSSMEELQSAIQAAIAHCKSSIAEKGCREV